MERSVAGTSASAQEEASTRKVRVLWIRHGETADNARQVIQGHIDTALNDRGILQAETTRDALRNTPIDICFSSDLSRAKRTAEIIVEDRSDKIAVTVDPRVKEKYLGLLEGTEYYKPHPPGALDTIEPVKTFQARLLSFFDSLFPPLGSISQSLLPDTTKDLTVMVVSHGGPIKTLLPLLWKQRNLVWTPEAEEQGKACQYRVWNCSISETIMHLTAEGWHGVVTRFADVSHLADTAVGIHENTGADADLADDAKKEAIRQYEADMAVEAQS